MFRKLKLKLTLINVIVFGLIFIFFSIEIYFLTEWGVGQESDRVLQAVAFQLSNGEPGQAIELSRRHANVFYIIVTPSGDLVASSPGLPFASNSVKELSSAIIRSQQSRGLLEFDHETYRFQMSRSSPNDNITLVFTNNNANRGALSRLQNALTFSGLAALLVVLAGGIFMANRALIPVKNSWQRQKDFVADASHELRTPLAVIQTNLELVRGNPEKSVESQERWLDNIQAETQRMARLVDDLLFLARADSEQATLNISLFPLDAALREALQPLEPVAVNHGVDLELSLDKPVDFRGDATRIKQLAVILVDNAIKYTPAGGSVKVQMAVLEKQVEFTVADTGEGIASEDLPKVFERFYRVDKSRSRDSGSSGLGLSIAQWIVSQHRGAIKVSSQPGQGTTFRVILPRS
jgi:signal transduction histidine kinase